MLEISKLRARKSQGLPETADLVIGRAFRYRPEFRALYFHSRIYISQNVSSNVIKKSLIIAGQW